MDIKIKSITMLNFMGQRNTRIEFNGENKSVQADNGVGKTTIADAFIWVLFGKNSAGATNFDIKTLDEQNTVLWRLPHEVVVELLIDGALTTLRRTYEEEWVKPRGSSEEQFKGHKVGYYWNDVPCSAGDYNNKVSDLCEESLFRLITSPTHFFLNLDDKERLRLLGTLEGNTTDDQFMTDNGFAEFLAKLNGKTLDEYKRELAVKISASNRELESLSTRLDEVKRNIPETKNWDTIESEISQINTELYRLYELQNDEVKSSEAVGEERVKLQNEINAEKLAISKHEATIRKEANAEYNRKMQSKSQLESDFKYSLNRLQSVRVAIEQYEGQKEILVKDRESLLGDYKALLAKTFSYKGRGVCSMCQQPLPPYSDEEIAEMEEKFNTDKANDIQANINHGTRIKTQITQYEEHIAREKADAAQLEAKIAELEANPLLTEIIEPVTDISSSIRTDKTIAAAYARIAELEKERDAIKETKRTDEYAAPIEELKVRRSELEKQLYVRTTIEQANARIAELESSVKTNSQTLLSLQGDADTIAQIQKSKALYIEERINSMFSYVRFKMVDTQINGGEKQICTATVGGVPYSTGLNYAARINAGLDVINAFVANTGISAPVFVDNAESVTELLPMTHSQVIRLEKVAGINQLTIN